MNNFPEITRAENEARREESIIERTVAAVVSEAPMRERLARGGVPSPPESPISSDGEAFFTFGNSLGEGALLAP